MNDKDKAKELIEKYAECLPSVFYNSVEAKNYHRAKLCALIAIDEILWLLNEIDYDLHSDNAIIFYNEVKQEIEKL